MKLVIYYSITLMDKQQIGIVRQVVIVIQIVEYMEGMKIVLYQVVMVML